MLQQNRNVLNAYAMHLPCFKSVVIYMRYTCIHLDKLKISFNFPFMHPRQDRSLLEFLFGEILNKKCTHFFAVMDTSFFSMHFAGLFYVLAYSQHVDFKLFYLFFQMYCNHCYLITYIFLDTVFGIVNQFLINKSINVNFRVKKINNTNKIKQKRIA